MQVAQRSLSTGAASKESETGQQKAEEQTKAEEEWKDEYVDEPLAAKISRWVWFSIKLGFVTAITGVVVWSGYTIVTTLLPGGASANAIMRRATDILRHEPELVEYFGDNMKTYGEDFGGSREGRRYFVREYSYTEDITDEEFHRVRFNLEGDRGRKATVWAEVKQGTYDFRYLIVLTKEKSRVWSIVDQRKPEPTLEERLSRVTSLLQDGNFVFYADNDIDVRQQSEPLSEYWLKVRCVRCDADPKRCEEAGVTGTPVWKLNDGTFAKGIKGVPELERMTKDFAKGSSGTSKWLSWLK